MLAARDQENLVHGHLAAAASKPLNQGARQMAPKTPAKVPKTPFKLPLNDENAAGLGGGKGGGKAFGKGNENTLNGAKKGGLTDKFTTPMGDKDESEEREIEYMPPRPKDMPDLPDDHFEPDLSIFENGGLMKGALGYFYTRKGDDGLSHLEREDQRQQKIWDIQERRTEAAMKRDIDSMPIPCTHYPDCHGDLCKDTIEARKGAEEQYKKTIAAIDAESAPAPKKTVPSKETSVLKSKTASTVLSKPKTTAFVPKATSKSGVPAAKPRLNSTLVSRPKNAPAPTNPSPMRHSLATAASKTTMGYSKGRAASTTLRKAGLPKRDSKTKENEIPDTSLCPEEYIERYGEPKFGSDMWIRCKNAGCFDKDQGPSLEEIFAGGRPHSLDALLREGADEDFQLTF
ncbi:hypothetical protein P7C71_g2708, partial [Lecanoromycetidae sp. Uapishka_2]